MSAAPPPSASHGRARTVARLAAELVAVAALLFVTRFALRAEIIVQADEMCHVGGIAVDVLAHGVRFPAVVYTQSDHDNGSLPSGILAAVGFAVFGRNVLVLRMLTLLITAAGALAALHLVRGCLDELGLAGRSIRWPALATSLLAILFAPRVATMVSFATVGFASPAEGSAINTMLLALFAHRARSGSTARTALVWAIAGFAFYLNKATAIVLPVIALVEVALAWRRLPRLAAAAAGFAAGVLPELLLAAERQSSGWSGIVAALEQNAERFPQALFDTMITFADYRPLLVAAWALALGVGIARVVAWAFHVRQSRDGAVRHGGAGTHWESAPITLVIVTGVACVHLAALGVLAQGGFDHYAVYGYPTIVVLLGVLTATVCAVAATRWGQRAGAWVGALAVAAFAILCRPAAVTWAMPRVVALAHNRVGAACSWRFARGFELEYRLGLAQAGDTLEEHVIRRCRSLTDPDQALDCIGGMARQLRQSGRRVNGDPPGGLTAAERHAYAFYYGLRRLDAQDPCRDFTDSALVADCTGAGTLACLTYADTAMRFFSGRGLGRPNCSLATPPMRTYWATVRDDLLSSTTPTDPGFAPRLAALTRRLGDLPACLPVFAACY